MAKISDMLNKELSEQETSVLKDYVPEGEKITQKTAIIASLIEAAKDGDVKAALYLMENGDTGEDIYKDTKLLDIQKRKRKRKK